MNSARQIVEEESAREWLRRQSPAPIPTLQNHGWKVVRGATAKNSFQMKLSHVCVAYNRTGTVYFSAIKKSPDRTSWGIRLTDAYFTGISERIQCIKAGEFLPVICAWTKKQVCGDPAAMAETDLDRMPSLRNYRADFIEMIKQLRAKSEPAALQGWEEV